MSTAPLLTQYFNTYLFSAHIKLQEYIDTIFVDDAVFQDQNYFLFCQLLDINNLVLQYPKPMAIHSSTPLAVLWQNCCSNTTKTNYRANHQTVKSTQKCKNIHCELLKGATLFPTITLAFLLPVESWKQESIPYTAVTKFTTS